jgi:hypothetical protein
MENPEMPHPTEHRPSDIDTRGLSVDDEVPEADRIEQAIPVEVEEVRLREPAGDHPEVDEADWLDQRTLEVGDDDDDR